MNQVAEPKAKTVPLKAEYIVGRDDDHLRINEALHQKLNKLIKAAVEKKIGKSNRYSIEYGQVQEVERKANSRAKQRYELAADIVFTD